ncbi:MAG: PIN/TRAM domain-containing protein [Bacillota bacterium]
MKKFIYGGIGLFFAIIVFIISYSFLADLLFDYRGIGYTVFLIGVSIAAAIIGVLVAPLIVKSVEKFADKSLSFLFKMSLFDILCSVFGLIIGLVIASLIGTAVKDINLIGPYLAIILTFFFGYIGAVVGYKKREDFHQWINNARIERSEKIHRMDRKDKKDKNSQKIPPKILDTSVIIDGRIADIYKTGFIEGQLIVANFVLEELRHIADSSDQLKRNRGRRGLDILNKMRQDFEGKVIVDETDYNNIAEVDSKLIKLTQDLKGIILTNDFNLNKVAQMQGVKVLNINELSNAVKPVMLPGEEMVAHVVKDGKEPGQGIAYLDDGTMVVIENGKIYLDKTIYVVVTSVLQTAAGRMVFARPKYGKDGEVGQLNEGVS